MKNIVFYNCGFVDCFFDGWSLNMRSLRWLLDLNKPKLMALLLFLNKPALTAILLALNKPRLMHICFLYNQDTIIQKKNFAPVYWFHRIIFIHYHLSHKIHYYTLLCTPMYSNKFFCATCLSSKIKYFSH